MWSVSVQMLNAVTLKEVSRSQWRLFTYKDGRPVRTLPEAIYLTLLASILSHRFIKSLGNLTSLLTKQFRSTQVLIPKATRTSPQDGDCHRNRLRRAHTDI
jgi:hypothetical protein